MTQPRDTSQAKSKILANTPAKTQARHLWGASLLSSLPLGETMLLIGFLMSASMLVTTSQADQALATDTQTHHGPYAGHPSY